MFSGADDDQIQRLSRLGGIVGTAFQISDDIIDIDSDPDESGKLPGTDLREGVHTLPVLYALHDNGPEADRLRELLVGPIDDDARWPRRWRCCGPRQAWPRPRTRWRDTRRRRARSWPRCPTAPAGRRWPPWSISPSVDTVRFGELGGPSWAFNERV